MKLLRLHINLFLVYLLSVLALSVAEPITPEQEYDLDDPVCLLFKEKANKKLRMSEDDFIEVYSKLKKPPRKPIPPEQAVPVYLQYRASIYNKSGEDVTHFYDRLGGISITTKFMQNQKKVIEDIYSGVIKVYEIEIDLNNDGIKNRVWQFYYPYIAIAGVSIGYISNHVLDGNNQLDTSFSWNIADAWGGLPIDFNGTSYFMQTPFIPRVLKEFDRGNYLFAPPQWNHTETTQKEVFNKRMREWSGNLLVILQPVNPYKPLFSGDPKKCVFTVELKPRRVK